MILLLSSSCLALPDLEVTLPSDVSVLVGDEYPFEFTVKNIGSDPLYDLTFSSVKDTVFSQHVNLSVNEQKTLNGTVFATEEFNNTFVMTSAFLYEITEPSTPKSVSVDFDSNGFNPESIELFVGDSVDFFNTLSSDATLKEFSGKIGDVDISAGLNETVLFSNVGEYRIFHQQLGFIIDISVINGSVGNFAHSSTLDEISSISISSKRKPSDLDITILNQDFDINYDDAGQGIVNIENKGTGLAENIELTSNMSEWISFEENNFTVDAGNNKLIKFFLNPEISKTKETNKTYQIKLTVSEGGKSTSESFNVFIKYANLNEIVVGNTTIQLVELDVAGSIELCSKNIDYPGCEELITIKEVPVLIELNATHEISEFELKQILESAKQVGDVAQRTENRFNSVGEDISDLRSSVYDAINELNAKSDEMSIFMKTYSDKEHTTFMRNLFIGFISFFCVAMILSIGFFKYYRYKKALHEGLFGGNE